MSWTMRGVRLATGSLVIAAGLVVTGGCSSGSAGVHLQTPDPPSSTPLLPTSSATVGSMATSSQPAVSSTPSPVSSSKTTPITTTPVTAPATATTASNPWPANFTSAQQAAAKASLAAVQGYIRVEAQANAQPGAKDWTAEIRRYTADPAAYQALKAIASLTVAKVHTTGTLTQDHVAVKSADSHQVIVTACVDTSKSDLVDSAGKSVIERPKNPRTVEMFTLYLYNSKDGGWLVSEKGSVQPPRTC